MFSDLKSHRAKITIPHHLLLDELTDQLMGFKLATLIDDNISPILISTYILLI